MFNRVLCVAVFSLVSASLAPSSAAASNDGAKLDSATGSDADAAPLASTAPPTFVESHSARVENDLMLFKPTLVGVSPQGAAANDALVAASPEKREVHFFVAPESGDVLEIRRERDKMVLFRGPQPQGAAVALGVAMFGAATVLSAHLPRPLRVIFDGPVHLGPAIFDGGGMGAGIAGRGW